VNSRERTLRAIEFQNPDKIPLCTSIDRNNEFNSELARLLQSDSLSDMAVVSNSDPDFVPGPDGADEWGCVWKTAGYTFGEVVVHPLEDWDNWHRWYQEVPDWRLSRRYELASRMREQRPYLFLMGGLGFRMMNLIDFRGYQNFMTDFYLEPERLKTLIALIDEKCEQAVERYAAIGLDAVIVWEDWGLQNSLMIAPEMWRSFFKEPMRRLIQLVHQKGLKFIFHCCGYILEIIDDLIEIGVDVLQLDQQKSMGLDTLSHWRGKICFFNPADIQFTSGNCDLAAVEDYCQQMVENLATPKGGFMYKMYSQPKAVEIPLEALQGELKAFRKYNPFQS